jgi:hypothetical protein
MGGMLTFVADRLRLFKTMAGAGALTPAALTSKSGIHQRRIIE